MAWCNIKTPPDYNPENPFPKIEFESIVQDVASGKTYDEAMKRAYPKLKGYAPGSKVKYIFKRYPALRARLDILQRQNEAKINKMGINRDEILENLAGIALRGSTDRDKVEASKLILQAIGGLAPTTSVQAHIQQGQGAVSPELAAVFQRMASLPSPRPVQVEVLPSGEVSDDQ